MKIRTRILLVVVVMSAVIATIGTVALTIEVQYGDKIHELEVASTRAFNGEHLNRLVTAVVMESRGVYASDSVEEAAPFAEGIVTSLQKIDDHIAAWQPLVTEAERPTFDAMTAHAAEFKEFRGELARLGGISTAQADAWGNNETNRANRKAFQAEIDKVIEEDHSQFEAIEADIAEFEAIVPPLVLALSVLGIVGGAGFAMVVCSQHIVGPVANLTRTMKGLANGELDITVPHKDKRDEMGQMAAAVEVFRENAIRVAEMSQDEKSRQEKAAARASMMDRFQSEFDGAVGAAVEGDFGKRIPTDFDPDVERIAVNFNSLLETVDRGLNETVQVLASLAETNLTRRVEGEYRGAFAQLKTDTNRVAESLSEIVGKLKLTSFDLRTATGEILSGANDLSERTTKQAATIEETSAAMEQLAQTVQENANRATDAASNAGNVTQAAEDGGEVMTQTTSAMERISTSSGKISNIIGMIDDIAFQTNLLALNASVEAARAGDAGKGFAVVAVEVRRLAQSAAGASAEVKALIEQSGTEVSAGSRLVVQAAEKLEVILAGARKNNDLLESIARESREQSSSIDEVNIAIRQMDEITQHNAALVEETNAAIEQTEAQATELDRIVDIFTVRETKTARRPEPAAEAGSEKGPLKVVAKVAKAAKTYLTQGNAAIDNKEWAEF